MVRYNSAQAIIGCSSVRGVGIGAMSTGNTLKFDKAPFKASCRGNIYIQQLCGSYFSEYSTQHGSLCRALLPALEPQHTDHLFTLDLLKALFDKLDCLPSFRQYDIFQRIDALLHRFESLTHAA